jgi:type IV pilus assembly protein PilF
MVMQMRDGWKYGDVFYICLLLFTGMLAACSSSQTIIKQDQSRAFRELGEAYMGQGQYTQALIEFKKAEQLYDKDPYLQNNLGLAYLAKRDPDLAIIHFQKAINLKSDYTPALNNLGTAYLEKEEWHQAIDCFEKATKDLMYMTPHFPLTNMGFAYYKLKDYNKAIRYSQDAIEISPNFPKAHHNLGLAFMAAGRHAEAVDALEQAAALAPKEAHIYFDLGRIYELRGNTVNHMIHSKKRLPSRIAASWRPKPKPRRNGSAPSVEVGIFGILKYNVLLRQASEESVPYPLRRRHGRRSPLTANRRRQCDRIAVD